MSNYDLNQIINLDTDKQVSQAMDNLFDVFESLFTKGGTVEADTAKNTAENLFKPILEGYKSSSNPKLGDLWDKVVDTLKNSSDITDKSGIVSNALTKENLGDLVQDYIKSPIMDQKSKFLDTFEKKPFWIDVAKKFGSGLKQQLAIVSTIMVFRPLIMLTDKAVPMKTRQYAATREFFTELFGLLNVLIVGKAIERAFTQSAYNKGVKALTSDTDKLKYKEVKWYRGLIDPLNFTKGGKKAEKLLNHLNDADWKDLPAPLKNAKRNKALFGGLLAVGLATAVLTPFLNNIVINEKVLNGIWKFLGQGSITPNSSGAHGGPPKLDTPNLAAERMMALMGRVNPSQTLNMYQNSQYTPYSANFSGVQKTPSINPLARI